MIKIGICDDDAMFIEDMERKIEDFFTLEYLEIEIKSFTFVPAFMESNMEEYDVIFLDVEMGEYNGLTLASEIREQNARAMLVYVSSFAEYAVDSYCVKAFFYILKDNLEKTLPLCLQNIKKALSMESVIFQIPNSHKKIMISDILYLESADHYIHIYGYINKKAEIIECYYGNLSKVEGVLAEMKFLRVQQSYIVNMQYISRFEHRAVVLITGEKINCSKKKYKELYKSYILWKGES